MNFMLFKSFISSLKQLTKFTKVKSTFWFTQKYILINENLILLLMLFIFQRPSAASLKTPSLASDLIIVPHGFSFVNCF